MRRMLQAKEGLGEHSGGRNGLKRTRDRTDS
jgi:hypothetical protein